MCDGKCSTGDHAHSAGPIGFEILSGVRYSMSYWMSGIQMVEQTLE